jgi:histidinol-phosphate aminotransferase
MAQAAAAAALFDEEFLNRSQRVNQEGLAQLGSAISSMGLSFIPSWGNFLLVKVGDAPDAGLALFKALLAKGVITRPVANYDLPQWLRISVGTSEENEKCIAAMKVVLPSLRSAA